MQHRILSFRLRNFMAFQDTGWITLRAVNLMFGRNSSGKSAIVRALLLLKQSINAGREFGPLVVASEEGTDVGTYRDFVHAHDIERDVTFSFKVDIDGEREHQEGYTSWGDAVGIVSSWADLHLTFGVTVAEDNRIVFKGFQITAPARVRKPGDDRDSTLNSVVFSANRPSTADEKRWIYSSDVFATNFSEDEVWRVVYPDFKQGFIPFLTVKDRVQDEKDEEQFGATFAFVASLLRGFRIEIGEFFRTIHYLGPIRSEPQRFYYIPQLADTGVGIHGQFVARAYLAADEAESERLELLNEWLAYAGLNSRLVVKPLDDRRSLYSVLLEETTGLAADGSGEPLTTNLRDVGFGASQALPVIIESLLADSGSTVIIEQPELHLHPAAQAEMGDLFIKAAHLGVRFLIETHSDNLIYRLRRRLAETTQSEQHEMPFDLNFHASDLAAYFIERNGGVSACAQIAYDKWGQYTTQPAGFVDFFGNDYAELLALDAARQSATEE